MGVIPPLRCRGNRTPLILSLSKDTPILTFPLDGGRDFCTPLILSLSKDKGEGTFAPRSS